MKSFVARAAVILFLPLLLGIPPSKAELTPAEETSETFDAEAFSWAYGQVIDSITVIGNKKTKSIALLREMESRVGERLDRKKLARDQRYLNDLSSIADIEVEVVQVRPGHCAIRLMVTERPTLLLKLIYPILEYDFNNDRFRYGFKFDDRNFRRLLESFSIDLTRNSIDDDNASIGWSTPWLGWQHIGVGGRLSYFRRGEARSSFTILEQYRASAGLSLPLTQSRISFSQVIGALTLESNRFGRQDEPSRNEVFLSPSLGYRLDRRDSRIKPSSGEYFYIVVQACRVVNGEGSSYFRLGNDVRFFRSISPKTVIALQSNFWHQFDKYPEYLTFGLGGAGTLRGFASGRFEGAHRWYQTVEWRISPFPKRFVRLPFVGLFDVTVGLVFFADTGIVWDNAAEFNTKRFHGGGGYGLHVYSPFQELVRLDMGFNAHGSAHLYFSTGIRF